MSLRTKIECPECDADLVVKRGGVCPNCGARITEHVAWARAREKRVEQVVAVVATVLVVGVAVVSQRRDAAQGYRGLTGSGSRDVLSRAPHLCLISRLHFYLIFRTQFLKICLFPAAQTPLEGFSLNACSAPHC